MSRLTPFAAFSQAPVVGVGLQTAVVYPTAGLGRFSSTASGNSTKKNSKQGKKNDVVKIQRKTAEVAKNYYTNEVGEIIADAFDRIGEVDSKYADIIATKPLKSTGNKFIDGIDDPILREYVLERENAATVVEREKNKKIEKILDSDLRPKQKIAALIKLDASPKVILNAMHDHLPRVTPSAAHVPNLHKIDLHYAKQRDYDWYLNGHDVADSSDPENLPNLRDFTPDEINRILQDVEETYFTYSDMEDQLYQPMHIAQSFYDSAMNANVKSRMFRLLRTNPDMDYKNFLPDEEVFMADTQDLNKENITRIMGADQEQVAKDKSTLNARWRDGIRGDMKTSSPVEAAMRIADDATLKSFKTRNIGSMPSLEGLPLFFKLKKWDPMSPALQMSIARIEQDNALDNRLLFPEEITRNQAEYASSFGYLYKRDFDFVKSRPTGDFHYIVNAQYARMKQAYRDLISDEHNGVLTTSQRPDDVPEDEWATRVKSASEALNKYHYELGLYSRYVRSSKQVLHPEVMSQGFTDPGGLVALMMKDLGPGGEFTWDGYQQNPKPVLAEGEEPSDAAEAVKSVDASLNEAQTNASGKEGVISPGLSASIKADPYVLDANLDEFATQILHDNLRPVAEKHDDVETSSVPDVIEITNSMDIDYLRNVVYSFNYSQLPPPAKGSKPHTPLTPRQITSALKTPVDGEIHLMLPETSAFTEDRIVALQNHIGNKTGPVAAGTYALEGENLNFLKDLFTRHSTAQIRDFLVGKETLPVFTHTIPSTESALNREYKKTIDGIYDSAVRIEFDKFNADLVAKGEEMVTWSRFLEKNYVPPPRDKFSSPAVVEEEKPSRLKAAKQLEAVEEIYDLHTFEEFDDDDTFLDLMVINEIYGRFAENIDIEAPEGIKIALGLEKYDEQKDRHFFFWRQYMAQLAKRPDLSNTQFTPEQMAEWTGVSAEDLIKYNNHIVDRRVNDQIDGYNNLKPKPSLSKENWDPLHLAKVRMEMRPWLDGVDDVEEMPEEETVDHTIGNKESFREFTDHRYLPHVAEDIRDRDVWNTYFDERPSNISWTESYRVGYADFIRAKFRTNARARRTFQQEAARKNILHASPLISKKNLRKYRKGLVMHAGIPEHLVEFMEYMYSPRPTLGEDFKTLRISRIQKDQALSYDPNEIRKLTESVPEVQRDAARSSKIKSNYLTSKTTDFGEGGEDTEKELPDISKAIDFTGETMFDGKYNIPYAGHGNGVSSMPPIRDQVSPSSVRPNWWEREFDLKWQYKPSPLLHALTDPFGQYVDTDGRIIGEYKKGQDFRILNDETSEDFAGVWGFHDHLHHAIEQYDHGKELYKTARVDAENMARFFVVTDYESKKRMEAIQRQIEGVKVEEKAIEITNSDDERDFLIEALKLPMSDIDNRLDEEMELLKLEQEIYEELAGEEDEHGLVEELDRIDENVRDAEHDFKERTMTEHSLNVPVGVPPVRIRAKMYKVLMNHAKSPFFFANRDVPMALPESHMRFLLEGAALHHSIVDFINEKNDFFHGVKLQLDAIGDHTLINDTYSLNLSNVPASAAAARTLLRSVEKFAADATPADLFAIVGYVSMHKGNHLMNLNYALQSLFSIILSHQQPELFVNFLGDSDVVFQNHIELCNTVNSMFGSNLEFRFDAERYHDFENQSEFESTEITTEVLNDVPTGVITEPLLELPVQKSVYGVDVLTEQGRAILAARQEAALLEKDRLEKLDAELDDANVEKVLRTMRKSVVTKEQIPAAEAIEVMFETVIHTGNASSILADLADTYAALRSPHRVLNAINFASGSGKERTLSAILLSITRGDADEIEALVRINMLNPALTADLINYAVRSAIYAYLETKADYDTWQYKKALDLLVAIETDRQMSLDARQETAEARGQVSQFNKLFSEGWNNEVISESEYKHVSFKSNLVALQTAILEEAKIARLQNAMDYNKIVDEMRNANVLTAAGRAILLKQGALTKLRENLKQENLLDTEVCVAKMIHEDGKVDIADESSALQSYGLPTVAGMYGVLPSSTLHAITAKLVRLDREERVKTQVIQKSAEVQIAETVPEFVPYGGVPEDPVVINPSEILAINKYMDDVNKWNDMFFSPMEAIKFGLELDDLSAPRSDVIPWEGELEEFGDRNFNLDAFADDFESGKVSTATKKAVVDPETEALQLLRTKEINQMQELILLSEAKRRDINQWEEYADALLAEGKIPDSGDIQITPIRVDSHDILEVLERKRWIHHTRNKRILEEFNDEWMIDLYTKAELWEPDVEEARLIKERHETSPTLRFHDDPDNDGMKKPEMDKFENIYTKAEFENLLDMLRSRRHKAFISGVMSETDWWVDYHWNLQLEYRMQQHTPNPEEDFARVKEIHKQAKMQYVPRLRAEREFLKLLDDQDFYFFENDMDPNWYANDEMVHRMSRRLSPYALIPLSDAVVAPEISIDQQMNLYHLHRLDPSTFNIRWIARQLNLPWMKAHILMRLVDMEYKNEVTRGDGFADELMRSSINGTIHHLDEFKDLVDSLEGTSVERFFNGHKPKEGNSYAPVVDQDLKITFPYERMLHHGDREYDYRVFAPHNIGRVTWDVSYFGDPGWKDDFVDQLRFVAAGDVGEVYKTETLLARKWASREQMLEAIDRAGFAKFGPLTWAASYGESQRPAKLPREIIHPEVHAPSSTGTLLTILDEKKRHCYSMMIRDRDGYLRHPTFREFRSLRTRYRDRRLSFFWRKFDLVAKLPEVSSIYVEQLHKLVMHGADKTVDPEAFDPKDYEQYAVKA